MPEDLTPVPTQAEADALKLQVHSADPAHFPPSLVDVPVIGGGGAPGSTLTCTMGNWDGMQAEPHSYAYSWRSGNAHLAGAAETYVVAEEDVGREICCLVTATNPYGSTMAPPSNKVTVAAAGTQAARSRSEKEEGSRHAEKEESKDEVRPARGR
jgi:hypothetical protein